MCKAVLDIQKMGEDKARLEAIKNIMKNGNQNNLKTRILLVFYTIIIAILLSLIVLIMM